MTWRVWSWVTWGVGAALSPSWSSNNLTEPALQKLAKIVHGADVARDVAIVPEAAGL